MAINTNYQPGISPVPTPSESPAVTAEQNQLKADKQQKSDELKESGGDKRATANKQTDALVKTGLVEKTHALLQALSAVSITEGTSLADVDVNTAMAQFQALMPLLGKPGGALAPDFTPPLDDVALAAWPQGLLQDVEALLKQMPTPAPGQPVALPTTGPWAKYAKVIEAFWKHDKTVLFEKPLVQTPATQALLTTLAPHIEALRVLMRSSYAPVIKGAKTATVPSDVPELPSFAERKMEEAFQLGTMEGTANALAQSSPEQLLHVKNALAGSATTDPRAVKLADAIRQHVPNFDTIDIEQLVWLVMTESAKTEEDIMRDQMKALQLANNQKKAQREKQNMLRESSARLDAQMKEEYHMLQAKGDVHPSITFEQYQSFRKVAWGDGMLSADGHFVGPKPTLTPLPQPLPTWLKTGKVADATSTGTGSGNAYGIDPLTFKSLGEMYAALPQPKDAFDKWLTDAVKIKKVTKTGKEGIDEVINNLKAVQIALANPETLKPTEVEPLMNASLDIIEKETEKLAILEMLDAAHIPGVREKLIEQRKLVKAYVDKITPKQAQAYQEWKDGALTDKLRTWGKQINDAIKYANDAALGWEGDEDRNVGAFGDVTLSNQPDGVMRLCQRTTEDHNDAYRDFTPTPVPEVFGIIQAALSTPSSGGFTLNGEELKSIGSAFGTSNTATLPPVPAFTPRTTDNWAAFNAAVAAAKGSLQDNIDALESIKKMPKNPDGSFYGAIPPGAEAQYALLIADKRITQGMSPEQARKKEEERKKIDEDFKRFMAGDASASHAEEAAMALNHVGSLGELKADEEKAKSDLDTMGDMTQMEQMRLQQMIEARSKMLEMLTNVMKKMSQLSDSIIANTK